MNLDYCSVIKSDIYKGCFPYHHTHVMKVKQFKGTQYFTGDELSLTVLQLVYSKLLSVREIKIVSLEDFSW